MQIIQESYIPLKSGDWEEHFKLSVIKTASWINERHQEFPNDSLKMRIFKYTLLTFLHFFCYIKKHFHIQIHNLDLYHCDVSNVLSFGHSNHLSNFNN